MTIIDPNKSLWYALHTRSRFENVVFDNLTKKSLEAFLPKMKKPSRRKDRRVILDVPIFPGYVFVKAGLTPETHLSILKTIGVVRVLGSNQGPVPIPEESLSSLRIMVDAGEEIFTAAAFMEGDLVIVVEGPFKGLTGIFAKHLGQGRVVVNIDILGQSAAVHVSDTDIERIP
ncbi:transcription termination factor NusG domain protein [Desulfoluna limicola]|uniref:Transcription termination factor NusG domain protein n=1 Tax=Desulfoluna limicola TaxID=2810562 RepID=A0ABN6F258_9BACT|nr:UpxY family transcription antiterminator [Desulfoluna limicola]BCS96593.1 transcription termination factor NusG domain protein [Desulfoluna limicola]